MCFLFGTVVYKSAFKYIDEFLTSLNAQLFKDFKLLIINDNVPESDLKIALEHYYGTFEIVQYNKQFTPIEFRVKLLLEAKKRNAELLIMGDFDDIFDKHRIEKVVDCARKNQKYSFYYNTIFSFDYRPLMPSLPLVTDSIHNIADYNYLGLSNTAIRVKDLTIDFIKSLTGCQQMIFDWYLYSRLLLESLRGCFVPGAVTLYRFHENNIVGMQASGPEQIQKEVNVKTEHYKSLKDRSTVMFERYEVYKNNLYKLNLIDSPSFWWSYTTGGK